MQVFYRCNSIQWICVYRGYLWLAGGRGSSAGVMGARGGRAWLWREEVEPGWWWFSALWTHTQIQMVNITNLPVNLGSAAGFCHHNSAPASERYCKHSNTLYDHAFRASPDFTWMPFLTAVTFHDLIILVNVLTDKLRLKGPDIYSPIFHIFYSVSARHIALTSLLLWLSILIVYQVSLQILHGNVNDSILASSKFKMINWTSNNRLHFVKLMMQVL